MNRTLSVRFAFLIVLLSVISALIIGSLFSALDPSILSGDKPGLSTYIAMFVGQGFLILPIFQLSMGEISSKILCDSLAPIKLFSNRVIDLISTQPSGERYSP